MARSQAQYLRFFSGSTTYDRWQNYYINTTVTWASSTWGWLPFDADGLVDGQTGDEGGLSVTLPATPLVVAEVEQALRNAWLVELSMYEFDTLSGNDSPQSGQVLIGSTVGELVGADGGFTSIKLQLGSSLAPVGAQVPPRTCTTRLVGAPCKL